MGHVVLRPLQRQDFPLVGAWLREPLVARWWHQDSSPDAVEREYGAAIEGREPSHPLLALHHGVPYGLVQHYALVDYPTYEVELAALCPVPGGALSLDYLIGEPTARGLGLGTAMVTACVVQAWAAAPHSGDVLVPVHVDNNRSWRLLERAGFVRIAAGPLEPDNPSDSRDHVVYRLPRAFP